MLLLRLNPRSWRERYGDELSALIREQRWSAGLVVDVVAGAIDARLHPQRPVSVDANETHTEGEKHMLAKVMKLRCAGFGPNVTARDQRISVAVTLGGTIVLTLIWMRIRVMYGGDNPYIDAFSVMPFLVPYVLTMPLTSLKGRSRAAQAVFVGGMLLVLTAIALVSGFIAARI